eukprot:CAMPEP_0117433874 /NCGR_PEP_ID=MMETSP0758-20121206/13162_1 /TAXON_ID=63605 /ORGANISM="Percolomonas cosmopolitus, Strain AE-1 (ATCC 50343)" /LENGTH=122 /DNA_ID=CAMNT_0005224827 /DNA_START=247 /DNA_END=615 /DNA_ORIENTATION=-
MQNQDIAVQDLNHGESTEPVKLYCDQSISYLFSVGNVANEGNMLPSLPGNYKTTLEIEFSLVPKDSDLHWTPTPNCKTFTHPVDISWFISLPPLYECTFKFGDSEKSFDPDHVEIAVSTLMN